MNDEIEKECGGEATTTIINEINKVNENSPQRKEEEKISGQVPESIEVESPCEKVIEEIKSIPASVDEASPEQQKDKVKEPQKFEEESKVHEELSSDETEAVTQKKDYDALEKAAKAIFAD